VEKVLPKNNFLPLDVKLRGSVKAPPFNFTKMKQNLDSEFHVGDRVKIIHNDLEPQYEGKTGKVKKVYPSFTLKDVGYRVEVEEKTIKGIATSGSIQKV